MKTLISFVCMIILASICRAASVEQLRVYVIEKGKESDLNSGKIAILCDVDGARFTKWNTDIPKPGQADLRDDAICKALLDLPYSHRKVVAGVLVGMTVEEISASETIVETDSLTNNATIMAIIDAINDDKGKGTNDDKGKGTLTVTNLVGRIKTKKGK